jgi:hypothetical protein
MGLMIIAAGLGAADDDKKVDEIYEAFTVNMSNAGPQGATTVQIHVARWSTEAEREALIRPEPLILNTIFSLNISG